MFLVLVALSPEPLVPRFQPFPAVTAAAHRRRRRIRQRSLEYPLTLLKHTVFAAAFLASRNGHPVRTQSCLRTTQTPAPGASCRTSRRKRGFFVATFGSDEDLLVSNFGATGFNRHTYLKFNVANLDFPAGSTATLRVYGAAFYDTVSASAYAVFQDSWTETGIRWNNRPALGTLLDTILIPGTGDDGYRDFDVTAFVQSERAAGHVTVSLGLRSNVVSDYLARFYAIQSPNTDARPQLLIRQSF